MAGDDLKNKNNFLISLNGQIHSAFFPFFDDVYCKYSFVCGPDWVIISGVEEGISQISKKGKDEEQLFIWNLPLNIVFKSTNPFGWPQLVVSAYGSDVFDNEVVRGYGVCHIPITPGPCEKEIPMFVPESSSVIQKFTSWLTGRRPEFIDPRILTQGDAREEMAPDIVKQQDAIKQEQHRAWQRNHLRNYKNESERAKTFNNWSVSFMDSEKLVKSGFYYTNKRDEVKCAYCGVRIDEWEEGDDPEEEHRKLSRNCPLVRGENPGENGGPVQSETEDNVVDEQQEEEEGVESEDVCGTYEYRPFSAPERPGKTPYYIEPVSLLTSFEQLGVSKMSGPVAPGYATYSARIKTFSNWRIGDIQQPEKIAEAGFYYTGIQDNVLCFHCGGGLKNWEAEDDPWVEHARWFSKCGFVILRKGREFIMDILLKEKRLLPGLNPKEPSNGCGSNGASAGQPGKEECREKETTNSFASTEPPSPGLPPVETEPTISSNVEGKEIELCRICYMRERGIVFLPCGHFISCTECALSLSSCAVCRKPFEATVRAYLS